MYGDQGLVVDFIKVYFNGIVGQSFGVWNVGGVELYLIGDVNDYVGKGMVGGLIVICFLVGFVFCSYEVSIIGNICLYGVIGGCLYVVGCVGECFGVCNFGVIIVVEGIGDNGCEYMMGGIVCILGKIGVNFGVGMIGGFVYVFDESGDFCKCVNLELVEVLSVDVLVIYEEYLCGFIIEYVQYIGFQCGEEILVNWLIFVIKFVLVKLKFSDVKVLLGYCSCSVVELCVQVQ